MSIKVFIDPGHGGKDPGAVNGSNQEKTIALKVAEKVKWLLQSDGRFQAKMSRENDTFISLSERANQANKWGADIFISIHCNSASPSANGIETFAYQEKYAKLATHIQNSILKAFPSIRNRGVKSANYAVLRETSMDACLVELGFISSSIDLQFLLNNQSDYAKAIYNGVLSFFQILPLNDENSDKLYIVATGAYKDVNNAKNEVEKLKRQGLDAYVHIHKEAK